MPTRNYTAEYNNYHSTEKQKKRRAMRNLARRRFMKSGRIKKGDGKDVHHKDGNPMNNLLSNLRITTKSANRSRKI
jgi:hypothetical protein